jgi:hypothetical protein
VTLIAAGDVPTADQLNDKILVAKAAGQIVNNTATLANDAELTAAVSANTTYSFQVSLIFTSNTTPDIKYAFTFPSGATCAWGSVRLVSGASPTGDADFGAYSSATSGTSAVAAAGTGGVQLALITGALFVGATAGSLTLQWAQNTANASDTTVHAGSWLLLNRS